MKKSFFRKINLIFIFAAIVGIFIISEMVFTEEVNVRRRDIPSRRESREDNQGGYGDSGTPPNPSPPPEVSPADVLTYDIEELKKSIRLLDGRDSKGDNYFWVEIMDTETGELLAEHKLELTHEYDPESIEDSVKVLFSQDERRMVISETKVMPRLSIPDLAATYIINVEDGSLTAISTERTWNNTWIDSSGEYLILVNVGDKYPPRGEAVTSYLRVYKLRDGQSTGSVMVSEEVDSIKEKNGFVGASYDGVDIKITRERPHWLRNEMERWSVYYRIGKDGSVSCVEDEMDYVDIAKADLEANIEGIEPDPDYGSKLRFISKKDKENGGYDVILHYYSDEYIVSYNFNSKLISITLPDGTVITPKDEPEISIELNESTWSFKIGLGGKADNLKYDAYGAIPTHQVKNIGKIPIDIDIKYGEVEGCKAGSIPGKDTFVVMCIDKIIPPKGSVVLYTNVEPNESKGMPLVYYAPTELDIDSSSMSATFEIRAYAAEVDSR